MYGSGNCVRHAGPWIWCLLLCMYARGTILYSIVILWVISAGLYDYGDSSARNIMCISVLICCRYEL